MRQLLEVPVVVGDVQLAPTTELAATASPDDRLDVLARVAASIAAEDAARDHIARLRGAAVPAPLPPRR